MDAVQQLAPTVGIQSACDALGVARASFYRQPVFGPALPVPVILRPAPARALCAEERETVRALLNSARFQDCAPAAVQATLLDEGQYLCSTRTMYRVLAQDGGTRERRDHLTHPEYKKPELLATAPNRLWSWDITKLRGPAKWTYFYLYVILDVFSRYVVGWMIAPREGAALASQLIEETCEKQIILPDQLTIHADRGPSMRSKPVALPAGRSQRHQDPQPALHFQRQSVFRKPVPHPEISPRLSRSLRLDSRQPRLLPRVLSLV